MKEKDPRVVKRIPEEVRYLPEDSIVRGLPLESFVIKPSGPGGGVDNGYPDTSL